MSQIQILHPWRTRLDAREEDPAHFAGGKLLGYAEEVTADVWLVHSRDRERPVMVFGEENARVELLVAARDVLHPEGGPA